MELAWVSPDKFPLAILTTLTSIVNRNHQPLQPTAILLGHMARTPEDPLMNQYREILDMAFASMGQDGGIIADDKATNGEHSRPLTEGGSEAWYHLRRLRWRIWLRDGADPSVLPSRSEAAVLCKDFENLSSSSKQAQSATVSTEQSTQSGGMSSAFDPLLDFFGSTAGIDWDLFLGEEFLDSDPHPLDYRML